MTSIADLIVLRLRAAGVRTLFGVPGGGSSLDLIEAAGHADVPFVLTATETAGAIAAIAQAELSEHPGACLAGLGPGTASIVNGVACARLERAPLIVLTDSHPSSPGAMYPHQRLDHRALLAPVTKLTETLDATEPKHLLDRALACAVVPPPGPVHIDVPSDVAGVRIAADAGRTFEERPTTPDHRPTTPDHRPTTIDQRLFLCRRPLMLIGLGARTDEAAAAIRAFAASHNVPAMVTYKAKGVVPDRDERFAGVFTNGELEREIVEQSDLLIAIGLDPVELLPRPWTYQQPVVHIGAVHDAHVPSALRIDTGIAGALEQIADVMPTADWDVAALGRTVAAQQRRIQAASDQLTADRVVRVASEAMPSARVTVDAGAHMFPATLLWPADAPRRMLISNGLSTMGFAVPAAIGAALWQRIAGDSLEPVVALTGDGGLLMCAGELLTAVRERLPIVIIVLSDGTLSLIDVKQRQRRFRSAGVALGDISWASLAESFRMNAAAATTEDELERALDSARGHRGPTLIDVRIDPATYDDTLRAVRG